MKNRFSLADLAKLTNSELVGDPDAVISSVADLESAGINDVSFLANPKYREVMCSSRAGVICIGKGLRLVEGKNFLISDDPSSSFQLIAKKLIESRSSAFSGIHPSAIIHESAALGKDVTIGPNVVIDEGVRIGENTKIFALTYIGSKTEVGKDCVIYSNVVIREQCVLKDRIIIQPGAVIGSCGFGFITNKQGYHKKLEQLGNVIIEDDVEIGANVTVDRARFKSTKIGCGTKIDNLVQIGHNVNIGNDNIIVSQTGIAGSAKTGRSVYFGGQAGCIGHVEICDNTKVATRGGVSKSIKIPGNYGGSPAVPLSEWNRHQVKLRKISSYIKRIKKLEERIEKLEKYD